MAKPLIITIKIAFWFKFYVYGVAIMSAISGRQLCPVKLTYWLVKATTFVDSKGNKIKRSKNDSSTNK